MTHIHFAAHLLDVSGESYDAIDCSLFPQIDRTPAYYHRLYAHSIPKTAPIMRAAKAAYWSEDETPDASDYFQTRLAEDRSRIRRYVTASPFTQSQALPSDRAMQLAFISHLYNDQFNNPIQAFVPFSVYPSGAWNLWESLDSAEFRWYLYEREAIEDFRTVVFGADEWAAAANIEGLITAMITRLADASVVKLDHEVVESALSSVGVEDVLGTTAHKEALELLAEHDRNLQEQILRVSVPRNLKGPRFWAGHGY